MFKKKKTYVIILIIILVAFGYYRQKSQKPAVEYTTAAAEKGKLARTVSVTGEVVAREAADLSFKTGGKVTGAYVDVGDKVEKGQRVADIDDSALRAGLREAQAALAIAQSQLDLARRNWDDLKPEEKDAKKEAVNQARAGVDAMREQIADTTLRAPFAGTVTKMNYEVGETAAALSSVLTVSKDGDLEIEADVPESDIVKVALGQKATVTFDALFSDDEIEAEVFHIDPASTVIQDVVYYKIKLKILKPDSRLKVGMSADIDISTAEKDNVVMIPTRSVKTEGGRKYVEVLDEDGQTTRQVDIETGLSGDEGMVEVTSGLSGGEEVVTLSKEN